jgi:hypothetical protein
MKPTVAQLREYLSYDPDTGAFTWIARPAQKIQIGDPAGQWGNWGYLRIGLFGKRYQDHVVAWAMMTGEWPMHHVDHKDRDRANNRWSNLRAATPLENSINASVRSDSKSEVAGVSMHLCGKWRAYLRVNGKHKHLGLFDNKKDAVAARIAAAKEQYGQFSPH